MKLKRFFALAGVILLIVMYVSTLVFSLMEGELAATLFKASVFCTLIIPIFLYIYTMFFKYYQNKNKEFIEDMENEASKPEKSISAQNKDN